jgi:Fic family protein
MIEYLFSNPFYTQERMSRYLKVHRNTASRYFKELEKIGLVKKFKYKNENIYYNQEFLDLLSY